METTTTTTTNSNYRLSDLLFLPEEEFNRIVEERNRILSLTQDEIEESYWN